LYLVFRYPLYQSNMTIFVIIKKLLKCFALQVLACWHGFNLLDVQFVFFSGKCRLISLVIVETDLPNFFAIQVKLLFMATPVWITILSRIVKCCNNYFCASLLHTEYLNYIVLQFLLLHLFTYLLHLIFQLSFY